MNDRVDRVHRAIHYMNNGVAGLLRGLNISDLNAQFIIDSKILIQADLIHEDLLDGTGFSSIRIGMSEEEFFQNLLLNDVKMTYEEYVAYCELSAILQVRKEKMYDLFR